jgi:hypothetical protein
MSNKGRFRRPSKHFKSITKNLREIMNITPKAFIELLNNKYNCSVSVQIREASKLGKEIRKELVYLDGALTGMDGSIQKELNKCNDDRSSGSRTNNDCLS